VTFVGLLRAVNVGGKNLVAMATLRAMMNEERADLARRNAVAMRGPLSLLRTVPPGEGIGSNPIR